MWNKAKERWKEQSWIRRYLCLVLVAVLVTTQCTQSMGVNLVIAQTSCSSHKQHDGTCGYKEEVIPHECSHTCDDGTCSYEEAVEAQSCDHICDENCVTDENGSCVHSCEDETCSYQEAVPEQPCNHICDDSCSYVEIVVVDPCTHSCDECNPEVIDETQKSEEDESINETQENEEDEVIDETTEGEGDEIIDETAGSEDEEIIDEDISLDTENDESVENTQGCLQHMEHDDTCGYVEGDESAVCTHSCLECNPAGDLSLAEAVFDKNTESENYKDIEVSFNKGADALERVERKIEIETEREGIGYVLSEDGETVTLTKETLGELEEGEYTIYLVMESGAELSLQLTVTNSQQVEEEEVVVAALMSARAADVVISDSTFPDVNFRSYVSTNVDKDKNGTLTVAEQTAVTEINISGLGISDLTGIGYFTNLTSLDCSNNQLTGWLDLGTEFSKLTTLNLSYNQLEVLLFSGMTSLTDLDISNNLLHGLDTGACPSLTTYDCSNNRFEVPLTLSGTSYPNLTNFDCSGNQIPNLNISGMTSLTSLDCSSNQLTELPISEMSSLTDLDCSDNELTGTLNLGSEFSKLTTLNLSYNQLEMLLFSGMTSLTDLDISNNLLTGLDTGACKNLTTFDCSNNQFDVPLNLSGTDFPNLTDFDCSGNQIPNLNISGMTSLTDFDCSSNQLTELIIDEMPSLTDFDCSNNPLLKNLTVNGTLLTKLNVSGCTELENLDCSDNQLAGWLNLGTEFSKLTTLNLSYNQLEGVQFSGMTSLTDLDMSNNLLTGVDTSVCPNLIIYDCSNNQFDVALNLSGTDFPKLTDFDCSNNPLLKSLTVNGTLLTKLNVSGCTDLENLDCSDNQLTGWLDLGTDFSKLTTLNLSYNQLENVWFSGMTSLADFDCSNNLLVGLYTGACPNLTTYDCSNNQFNDSLSLAGTDFPKLTDFDCSNNPLLKSLTVNETLLTKLNVSGCTDLENLDCSDNQLAGGMNLGTEFSKLTTLNLSYNQLEMLQFSGMTSLTDLDISNNLLHGLDTGACPNLTTYDCSNNRFDETLNLPRTSYPKLTDFDCSYNQVPNLNISGLTSLIDLDCSNNRLTELAINEMPSLTDLNCSYNQLTFLDISGLKSLTSLIAGDQKPSSLKMTYNGTQWVDSTSRKYVPSATTFYSGSGMSSPLSNFSVGGDGIVTATTVTPITNPIYFKSKLYDGADGIHYLSGSVSYTVSGTLTAETCYMDISTAKALSSNGVNQLAQYFTIKVGDAVPNEDMTFAVSCAYYSIVRKGTIGSYPVTISYGGLSTTATLEVGLDINGTNFPDTNFQTYISTNCDTDKEGGNNGFLTSEELVEVTEINLSGETFNAHTDLTGIEHFTNLTTLTCNSGNMSSLNAGKSTSLTTLEVSGNTDLTDLNVSGCANLQTLRCTNNNKLENLDVSSNEYLTTLYCSYNNLTALALDKNTELIDLACDYNELTSLNVADLSKLEILNCTGNRLTTLDVDGLSALRTVDASQQRIEQLSMNYQEDRWNNVASQENAEVRKFHTNIKEFLKSGTTEKLDFYVESSGKLAAGSVLPMVQEVYFEGDLNSDASYTWILSGTFSYAPAGILLGAKTLYFTSTEIKEQIENLNVTSAAELKNLESLISVTPDLEEIKNEIVTSMDQEAFEALVNGTEAAYDYTATLDLLTAGIIHVSGQIVVLPDDAVSKDDQTAYIHAKDFFIGTSSLTNGLEAATVIQKSSAVYEGPDKEGNQVTHQEAEYFTVASGSGDVSLEQIISAGTYTLTITHTDSGLQTNVTVTVLDDAASSLVFIPASIELTRVEGQKHAKAESYVELVENAEKILEGTINVYTDASLTLTAEDAKDQILVDVYTEENESHGDDIPLATLDSADLKDTFLLISSDITTLQGMAYEGTMKFTIKYEKESDGNES